MTQRIDWAQHLSHAGILGPVRQILELYIDRSTDDRSATFTARELSEELGYSRRTIFRYLAELRERDELQVASGRWGVAIDFSGLCRAMARNGTQWHGSNRPVPQSATECHTVPLSDTECQEKLARELLTRTVAGDTLPDVVGINTDYDTSTSVESTREPSQAETSALVVGRSVEDPNLFKLDTEEIAAQMKGAEPRYIAAARLESIDFSEYPGDGTQLAAEVFGLCYSNDGACYAAARRLVKLTPTLSSTTRLTKLAERLAELMTRNSISAVPKDPRTAVDWSGCEKWVEPRQASTLVVETDRPTDEDRRTFLGMVRGAGANFLEAHNDDLQVEQLEEVSA